MAFLVSLLIRIWRFFHVKIKCLFIYCELLLDYFVYDSYSTCLNYLKFLLNFQKVGKIK